VIFLALLVGMLAPSRAGADVSNTVHNLSSSGPAGRNVYASAGQTNQVCVFCHTPHGAGSELPLWNHQPTAVAAYTLPDNAMPLWMPDKGSRLCLSCHDGTVALGALINMPGTAASGTVLMEGPAVDPSTKRLLAGSYGFLGIDLSTTHPISIAVNDTLINDKNTCTVSGSFMLQYPPAGDPVKLKPTDNTYGGSPGRSVTTPAGFSYNEGVQCATCHDPHDNTNGDFLVKGTPLDQTPLCTTCHQATCP